MIENHRIAMALCGLLASSIATTAYAQMDTDAAVAQVQFEDASTTIQGPQFKNAPVYVYRDDNGALYRWEVTFSPAIGYTTQMVPYVAAEFAQLSSQVSVGYLPFPGSKAAAAQEQHLALVNPEASDSACTNVPPVSNFTIYADSSGTVHGNMDKSAARPSDTYTGQYLDFQFTTTNYYGQPSHTIVVLFSAYNNPGVSLEGWGGLFGNNSQSYGAHPGSNGNPPYDDYYGCGTSSLFNTQVEAWYLKPPGTCCNANFQSRVFPDNDYPVPSCGVTLGDSNQYRMQMQASTGSWVSYQVLKFISLSWYSITGWKGFQTTAYPWVYTPTPTLDTTGNKNLSIAATTGGSNWSISVTNLSCGWYY
jgi:hypothetical protein